MKQVTFILFLIVLLFNAIAQKPRLLITTDIGGDPDDQQSLVRLMVYSNEFEIEGIISSASGTQGELGVAVIKPELVEEIIHGYGQVYLNLKKHDKNYPLPEKLLSLVKHGNPNRGWENVGEGNDTQGSEFIIQAVDKKDKRPFNICIFGGQTDLAQALWKVKSSRSKKEYHLFISKIRVYDINDQDKIFDQIFNEHPSLFYVLAKSPEGADKREGAYRGMYLGGDESLTSIDWLTTNVIENHGALGKLYPTKTWTAPNPHGAMKEGDTPSWFFFLNNGLNVPEQPELGGWGGRFIKNETGFFSDAEDSFLNEKNARATVFRWRGDFQHDWAARMDWCIKDYADCNHVPHVSVNGSSGTKPLIIQAKPGELIKLDASASSDPDRNQLQFEWMLYPENEKFSEELNLVTESAKASFVIPELKKGESIPILLKVIDNGSPQLVSYRRVILNP